MKDIVNYEIEQLGKAIEELKKTKTNIVNAINSDGREHTSLLNMIKANIDINIEDLNTSYTKAKDIVNMSNLFSKARIKL